MKLSDIFTDKKASVFSVVDQEYDNELDWMIRPTKNQLIPKEEGYYFVRALQVGSDETTECFLEVVMPERVAENIVKIDKRGDTVYESIYDEEIFPIPVVACEGGGDYELYLSEEDVEVGIEILKAGLELAENKNIVAEDLGFLLSDEGRVEEAIEALLISEAHGPSVIAVYQELAELYRELGDEEKHLEYLGKYKAHGGKVD